MHKILSEPKRVLLAWELGANLGHLRQMLAIARALRDRGDEVVFAVRDVRHAEQQIRSAGFRVLAAPTPPAMFSAEIVATKAPASYLDILALQGIADVDSLQDVIGVWQDIFALTHSEVMVAESAPFAVLAASLARLPHVAIGTGFTLPPTVGRFPDFGIGHGQDELSYSRDDVRITTALNRLAESHNAPPYRGTHELFRDARKVLVTWPELDHYQRRAASLFIGPLPTLGGPVEGAGMLRWRCTDVGRRVFGYLQPSYVNLHALFRALHHHQANAVLVIPGGEEFKRQYANERITILTHHVPLTDLLTQADLVVTHGGHNMCAEALIHGKALLMFPHQIEQAMLASRLAEQKLALKLSPREGGRIVEVLGACLNGSFAHNSSLRVNLQHRTVSESSLTAMIDVIDVTTRRGWIQG